MLEYGRGDPPPGPRFLGKHTKIRRRSNKRSGCSSVSPPGVSQSLTVQRPLTGAKSTQPSPSLGDGTTDRATNDPRVPQEAAQT